MASSSSKTSSAPQTRQKRILPSRSRRGGPGVGSCDVDVMILDTYKRQAENEPLIPANTPFLLTTDSSQVPLASTSSSASAPNTSRLHLNLSARERYFDRPDVIKAYKQQLTIQTPEYTQLSEDASVGGRFRPRGAEDSTVDTSDTAYEKRHRKYETFEKRQRLREKEKLKHEQYKLKERIDQLRAMDGAAFLSLPASTFTPPSGHSANGAVEEEEDLSGAHINGAAAYNEGERRRKEMLDVALSLEERYRVLLPPDRMKKSSGKAAVVTITPEQEITNNHDVEEVESASEPEEEPPKVQKQAEKLKLRIPARARNAQKPPSKASSKANSHSPLKLKHKYDAPTIFSSRDTETASPTVSSRAQAEHSSTRGSAIRVIRAPSPAYSNPEIAVMEDVKSHVPKVSTPVASDAPPRKRLRTRVSTPQRDSLPPIETISAPLPPRVPVAPITIDPERTKSCLVLTAIRTSKMPRARKVQRHHMAFGFKVPLEIDELRDFELPEWVRDTQGVDDDWDHLSSDDLPGEHRQDSTKDVFSPPPE